MRRAGGGRRRACRSRRIRWLCSTKSILLGHGPPASHLAAVAVSALVGAGIDALLAAIADRLVSTPPRRGEAVPFTDRQASVLESALQAIDQADAQAAIAHLDDLARSGSQGRRGDAASASRDASFTPDASATALRDAAASTASVEFANTAFRRSIRPFCAMSASGCADNGLKERQRCARLDARRCPRRRPACRLATTHRSRCQRILNRVGRTHPSVRPRRRMMRCQGGIKVTRGRDARCARRLAYRPAGRTADRVPGASATSLREETAIETVGGRRGRLPPTHVDEKSIVVESGKSPEAYEDVALVTDQSGDDARSRSPTSRSTSPIWRRLRRAARGAWSRRWPIRLRNRGRRRGPWPRHARRSQRPTTCASKTKSDAQVATDAAPACRFPSRELQRRDAGRHHAGRGAERMGQPGRAGRRRRDADVRARWISRGRRQLHGRSWSQSVRVELGAPAKRRKAHRQVGPDGRPPRGDRRRVRRSAAHVVSGTRRDVQPSAADP